jgi:hypothetical protein
MRRRASRLSVFFKDSWSVFVTTPERIEMYAIMPKGTS